MSDHIKLALDKAASSPDAAVRQMALSYKEMENRLDALRSFFSFYAEGVVSNGKGHHAIASPEPVRAAKPKPVTSKKEGKSEGVKAAQFTEAILGLLRHSAQPVPLPDLQRAYEALNLEQPMHKESFRQRMHKRQKAGDVLLYPRIGFWPPEPRPGEAGNA